MVKFQTNINAFHTLRDPKLHIWTSAFWERVPQSAGRQKTWCQEIMSTEPRHWMVLARRSCTTCMCSAEAWWWQCPSTALHRHDQLAKYHPVPWLRWHNVSWHQVFCYWGPWFLVLGSLLFVANCCYLVLMVCKKGFHKRLPKIGLGSQSSSDILPSAAVETSL